MVHCERIVRYVPSSLSLAAFLADDEKQDAAVFNITQIGELANAILSDECKDSMPTVEWNALIRMRHKIVHHYEVYSAEFAWVAATQEVPRLVEAISEYLDLQCCASPAQKTTELSLRKMNLGGKSD